VVERERNRRENGESSQSSLKLRQIHGP
jgi:hypothetical protein